jgi:hypothetical protein
MEGQPQGGGASDMIVRVDQDLTSLAKGLASSGKAPEVAQKLQAVLEQFRSAIEELSPSAEGAEPAMGPSVATPEAGASGAVPLGR